MASTTTSSSSSSSGVSSKAVQARMHISEIRSKKFSIGKHVSNPLTQDLHNAVINLSNELYTKDVHFIMELIQNAEDNEYPEGVEPTLEFVLTTKDITGLGAPATLLVFNNEVGFSRDNIESLCSIGRSTKKAQRHKGFIGEKGIGFKSVFIVSAQPHIYSNGYKIKFNEAPNRECGMGYIVPEFVIKPYDFDIQKIYGYGKILPATTIILPLKKKKLNMVKKHLSEIHPEVLLFLHKIKRLSVRENDSPVCDSISAISIASEINVLSLQTERVDSRIVHLSVQEKLDMPETTCRYFIYRQFFPVDDKNMVDDARNGVNEWSLSLAFPFGDRLSRGTSSIGVFAFLPTAMVTNFPFIIQADFILASSREAIRLDSRWNLSILDQVPSSFINAVMTCIESPQLSEMFIFPRILEFMPLKESPVRQLNSVRDSIRLLAGSKFIVPCETLRSEDIVLLKPTNVVRILPEFRKILSLVKDIITPDSVTCYDGMWYLHKSVDTEKYNELWDFLGVHSVEDSYGSCLKFIHLNNIVFRGPRQLYMDILCFFANNWKCFASRTARNIPLFKYIGLNEDVLSCTITQIKRKSMTISFVDPAQQHPWLEKWNDEMDCPGNYFLLKHDVATAIAEHKNKNIVTHWLDRVVGVKSTNVYYYCYHHFRNNERTMGHPKLAVSLTHLVYHSTLKGYLKNNSLPGLLRFMPVVERSGKVSVRTSYLVPASGSKWAKLFDFPKNDEDSEIIGDYVELGKVYAETHEIAGECTPENHLLTFLKEHRKAIDLPDILPPDNELHEASCALKSYQALLLLEWIRSLRAKEGLALPNCSSTSKYKIPEKFIESIKCGKWLKTSSGFSSPKDCYLYNGTEPSTILEIGKALNGISAIDEVYYLNKIRSFSEELIFLGVQFRKDDLYGLIVDRIKSQSVSSQMSADLVFSLLRFIKYSNQNKKIDMELLKTLKDGNWLKTRKGCVTPPQAVYVASGIEEAVSQFTDLCVVDTSYYGNELCKFVNELKFLGVITSSGDVYKLISKNFMFPEDPSKLTKEAALLSLKCIRKLDASNYHLRTKLSVRPWISTTLGFKSSSESLLLDPNWEGVDKITPLPIIQVSYYGTRFLSYKKELEEIGVAVNFNQACNMLIGKLKSLLFTYGLSSETVISLLVFLKSTKTTMASQLSPLVDFFSKEIWLKTCQGYHLTSDSILSDSKWRNVSNFADLPFIDEIFYGTRISSFKDELKMLGVVVDFDEGAHILARGVNLPVDAEEVPAYSAKLLLQCARSLRRSTNDQSLLEQFVSKLKGNKWVNTHLGYLQPGESLIMNKEWINVLEETDGAFIKRGFYGTLNIFEIEELKALGMKSDTFQVCSSLFQNLTLYDETPTITRVYRFLCKEKWNLSSEDETTSQLWIPDRLGPKGKWVNKSACVLHDRDYLFGSFLHILDRHYNEELLLFMSTSFGVDTFPTLSKYVDLWASWAANNHSCSFAELNSFWRYISENWDTFTEQNLGKHINVVPATTVSGTVQLMAIDEVFIPDDLQLKNAFSEVSQSHIFVWFPQNGSTSLTRLYKVYESLGVRKLSKSVKFSTKCNFEKLVSKCSLIRKPLVKIVLAFLASPAVNMIVEERQRTLKSLLDVEVYGADHLMVDCSLHLPVLDKILNIEVKKLVLWERNFLTLLVHKPSWNSPQLQEDVDFIFDFSQAIAEIVLPNVTDPTDDLCRIIKMGFAFGFKEKKVDSLLRLENLELSTIDKNYLDCLFPAVNADSPASAKRPLPNPHTPQKMHNKKQR